MREKERGYEDHEDLYRPGYFELPLRKGDQLVFSAGTTVTSAKKLKTLFSKELAKLTPLDNFKSCLERAAKQFIVSRDGKTEVNAGFHWFGRWGRDTFIALPGLTLTTGHAETCKAVLDTMVKEIKNGLFPNAGYGENAIYNTADASLWFIWAVQQYMFYAQTAEQVWDSYGEKIKNILSHYRKGTSHEIRMQENGLLATGREGEAVTWMDAIVHGKPVTSRTGLAVELNALWYNAICFSLEAARAAGDQAFIEQWKALPQQIKTSFVQTFWDAERGYLADSVNGVFRDWSIRPNQVIAVSLHYSPIDRSMAASLLEIVKKNLLTSRGLRTLSPEDPAYQGTYAGDQTQRDLAYHQGTVWPWLIGHFAEAWLKTHGSKGEPMLHSIYENFSPAITEYCIGTIAELYSGNAPHEACGAISQAWSIAELLRLRNMISVYSKKELFQPSYEAAEQNQE